MIPRSSFRNIYLRLDSPSYKFLKAIRDGREVLAQPRSAIGIIHNFVYDPDNVPNNGGKVLEQVLNDVTSMWAPFNFELTYPFRVRTGPNQAVNYDIQSLPLIKLHAELSSRLRDLSVFHSARIKLLGDVPQRTFRPSISIQQMLQEHAADKLMDELKQKYGVDPGSLRVDGLSLGPQRKAISESETLAHMDDESWKHFPFTGTE